MPTSWTNAFIGEAPPAESSEEGSAIIEFMGLGTLLILPILWLLIAVSHIQAAAYATVGAADQAAKMAVASDSAQSSGISARSEAAVHAALGDFSISEEQATISYECAEDCQQPGEMISVTVEVSVPVPFIPQFAGFQHQLVTVSATAADVRGR